MNSVRLWYKKSGLAIYTSHLDMNRCFTRAVRMAGIPIWYTEGFNPHPYITFLLPLPLGQTGTREPIDIRTEQDISAEEIKSRLNAVLPQGIEIIDVTESVNKSALITSSRYIIDMDFGSEVEATGFACGISDVIDSGVLNAEKRSKRGTKTVNLCEYVESFSAVSDGCRVRIETVLKTGTDKNLNPALLCSALCSEFAAEPLKTDITRTEIYMESGKIFF